MRFHLLLVMLGTGCLDSHDGSTPQRGVDGKGDGPSANWVAAVKTALTDGVLQFDEATDIESLPHASRLAYEEHVLVHGFGDPLDVLAFEHDGESGHALASYADGGSDVDLFDSAGVQFARAFVGEDDDVQFRSFQRIDVVWVEALADAFKAEPTIDDVGDVSMEPMSRSALPAIPRAYFDHERDTFGVDFVHAYKLAFDGESGFVVVASAEAGSADGFVKLFTAEGRLAAAGIGQDGEFRLEY
jgi:hypothetical protein